MNQKPTRRQIREQFISSAKLAREDLYKLLSAYENLSIEDNDSTSESYPFGQSYDEWIAEYDNWIDTIEQNWFPEKRTFFPTITVGDLKEVLKSVDDDTQIVIWDKKYEWWFNIHKITIPDEDGNVFTVVLHPQDTFDTRQF